MPKESYEETTHRTSRIGNSRNVGLDAILRNVRSDVDCVLYLEDDIVTALANYPRTPAEFLLKILEDPDHPSFETAEITLRFYHSEATTQAEADGLIEKIRVLKPSNS